MAGHSSAAVAHTANNPFLRAVAALSTLAGWCSAAMIVAAVAISFLELFVAFLQAFIFMFLTAVFISQMSHHHEDHHEEFEEGLTEYDEVPAH